ncbi:MAG: MGH1-like glycoside hydrolase domain-containing protein [Anaerolineae bacterium]
MSHKNLWQYLLCIVLILSTVTCHVATPTPTVQPTAIPARKWTGPKPLIAQNFERWTEQLPPMDNLTILWGPYMAEREWGNPREAVQGDGWGFTYDMAMDTKYRYGEDGIAGWTDLQETICFAFAFWDERQPYVTERLYGLNNPEGRYGETILEQRIFWENTPAHSYARYEYHYPREKPNFVVDIVYAKRDNQTTLVQVKVTASEAGVLHLLPMVWLRGNGYIQRLNWNGYDVAYNGGHFVVKTATVPSSWQISANATGKKGDFNRAITKNKQLANAGEGNRAAWDLALSLQAGETQMLYLALANAASTSEAEHNADATLANRQAILSMRQAEAEALYRNQVTEHEDVYRYALMNLLWNKMYYEYDGSFEANWQGRVNMHDVVLVPDKWEFPWPAMWDTCFQAKVATLTDIILAKDNLLLFLSPRWQTDAGHVPNVEWFLDGETPPLFGWAAWEIYKTDGDLYFLERIFPRLELHYSYCRRALDEDGDGLYTGGFMGMDNIPRPDGPDVEQADTSAWMAFFAKHMSAIAQALGYANRVEQYKSDYTTLVQHINDELWNEEDGFYYDRDVNGPLRIKSYVGLIPLIAGVPDEERAQRVLSHLSNPYEFWSNHGIRSMARNETIYEAGYSTSGWKNSNWRGPIWMPINYLLVQALGTYDAALAERLRENLVRTVEQEWQATYHFFEYYHGETGKGLGADHQTGWTALVANLIKERWGH